MSRILAITLGVVSILVLGACATPGFAPQMKMADAEINPESVTGHALRWLPSPSQPITVAVYGIADETGAFKPNDGGQTLSRAVTQAPTPILIKALHDAGNRSWFDVIERENLGNLIKERQIVQEMRARYLGETELNQAALPALKFAGVLIEGAITGYDTNTRTGGAGARYLGIGGSTQYREDAVSVYLRAVSVKTGEVLISITSQQRVASVALQGDAFRFVSFQRLLEAEAGITLNQPRHMAVRQALEKAVYGLIVEGAEFGLWGFEDPNAGSAAIDHYRENYAPYARAAHDGRLPAAFYQAHHDRDARRRERFALASANTQPRPTRVQAPAQAPAPTPARAQERRVPQPASQPASAPQNQIASRPAIPVSSVMQTREGSNVTAARAGRQVVAALRTPAPPADARPQSILPPGLIVRRGEQKQAPAGAAANAEGEASRQADASDEADKSKEDVSVAAKRPEEQVLSALDQESLRSRAHLLPDAPDAASAPVIADAETEKSKADDVLASAGLNPGELASAASAGAASVILLNSGGGL